MRVQGIRHVSLLRFHLLAQLVHRALALHARAGHPTCQPSALSSPRTACPSSSRAPCACRSSDMSAFCAFISSHSLSIELADTMWHLRSTCHVMGVNLEQISLLRVV